MNQQHCTLTEIAIKPWAEVRSTISREIKRNTGGNGYRYKQAHRFAQMRHKQKYIKLNDKLRRYIQQKLKLHWSPEQISGRQENGGKHQY